jgi:hypothetical protein
MLHYVPVALAAHHYADRYFFHYELSAIRSVILTHPGAAANNGELKDNTRRGDHRHA